MKFLLTGATFGAGVSDLEELIEITDTSGSPLEISFFQYVNLDLNGVGGDDSLVMSGVPTNTATQIIDSMIGGATLRCRTWA